MIAIDSLENWQKFSRLRPVWKALAPLLESRRVIRHRNAPKIKEKEKGKRRYLNFLLRAVNAKGKKHKLYLVGALMCGKKEKMVLFR